MAHPHAELLAGLQASGCVVEPRASTKVYKDECMFSFTNCRSEDGVYVNLATFQCFSKEFLDLDAQRTGKERRAYLHVKWNKVLKEEFRDDVDADGDSVMAPETAAADATVPAPEAAAAPTPPAEGGGAAAKEAASGAGGAGAGAGAKKDDTPTEFAIGTEGGFQVEADKYRWDKLYTLVVMPENVRVPYPDKSIPLFVTGAITDVINRTDAKQEAAALVWKEERKESKYANDLVQLPTEGKLIATSGWSCEKSGDTENLWLNLSTGYIGGGRKFYDGSGGSNAAVEHFEETGSKYPLVVKLGTITPYGADVYSYAPDEDDMVVDPKLEEHLKHWGIDMMSMKKTARTMDELQIELNLKHEWNTVMEGGKKLKPLAGPGLVGLVNVGNSCYFNSVIQCLFSLPEMRTRYLDTAPATFASAPTNPATDINAQMCKLAVGLLTDKYVPEGAASAAAAAMDTKTEEDAETEQPEVAFVEPGMVKTLLGQGHSQFSTRLQQDAAEYLQYLFGKLETADRTSGVSGPASAPWHFKFKVENRLVDDQSRQVRYREVDEDMISLDLPMSYCTNAAAVEAYKAAKAAAKEKKETFKADMVHAMFKFDTLLAHHFSESKSEGFLSPVTGVRGTATNSTRFATFPKYLWMQLRKYVVTPQWTIEKLESSIDMPLELDLTSFRAKGLQEGEVELKEASTGPAAVEVDETALAMILPFGFSENACRKALIATTNNAEAAGGWLMEHMNDPDFNDPPATAGAGGSGAGASSSADPAQVSMLSAMLGITERHAAAALEATDGNLERAADWALSHDEPMETDAAAGSDAVNDGPGKYKLKAIVSHMGGSTTGGHYVCHVIKDGQWVFFNDSKVAASEDPPIKYGYMYLYERVDA